MDVKMELKMELKMEAADRVDNGSEDGGCRWM